ncbi:unnamed protein product [Rhizoctonia solani]|uniref:J domain-containing protein n=1 Tax=Rhizoctonia solani TaxID=456999 RepID=A0A8H3BG29_9AGAM|nr:unnamed protein product [Rhizoctonia solani]
MDFDPDHNDLNHRNAQTHTEDDDGGLSSPVDESLYTLFNVSKNAPVEEIRERYKSLAVSLHPDKVRDDAHKAALTAKFTQVKRAYEILTDPSKRAIYDLFGEDGLKTKWDVGSKYKTEEELRNEYARLARTARLQDAENIVRSQGELVCAVNASSLTTPGLGWQDKAVGVSQAQLGLKHKFDTDISDRTRFTLTSRLISMRGRAGGNVFGTLKHQFSPRLQVEATSGFLEPRTIVPKATFEVNEATTLRAESTIILANVLEDVPRLTLTGQRLLDPTLTGVISFTTPTLTAPSALAVSLSSTGGLATTVELSPVKLQLSAEYGVRVGGKNGVLLTASAATGLNQGGLGMAAEINGTAKLAESTSVRVGVAAALPGGISLKIILNRLGQRIVIPVQLSREFDLNLALYTAVIPSISAVLVNQYILKPQRQKRAKGRLEELRERQTELIVEERQAAEHYIESIREQLKKKIDTERSSDGLIISEARYGPAKFIDDKNRTIDVSAPLQLLVNSSQLVIPGSRSKPQKRKRNLKIRDGVTVTGSATNRAQLVMEMGPAPSSPPHIIDSLAMQAQQATCTNVHIRTTADAHRIFHATLLGIYTPINRRLDIEERRLVKPGACFVWEERGPDAEATGMGIERWTDGLRWGPSRVRDDFLFYHQRDTEADDEDRAEGGDGGRAPPAKWLKKFARRRKADSPHGHHSSSVSPRLTAPGAIDRTSDKENDRLIKQTYSVFATIPGGGRQQRKWHITAYFTQGTIEFLRTVDQIPELAPVHPPPGTYRSARATGSKKNHEHIPPPHPDFALAHHSHPRQLETPIQWSPYMIPAPVASTSSHRPPSTHEYHSPEPIRELPHPLSPVEVRPASGHQLYQPPTPTSGRSSISPFTRALPLPRQGTNAAMEDVYLPPLSVSPFPYAQRNATDDRQLDALLRRFMIPGTRPESKSSPSPDSDSSDSDMHQ